jgi:hypothetical protein
MDITLPRGDTPFPTADLSIIIALFVSLKI